MAVPQLFQPVRAAAGGGQERGRAQQLPQFGGVGLLQFQALAEPRADGLIVADDGLVASGLVLGALHLALQHVLHLSTAQPNPLLGFHCTPFLLALSQQFSRVVLDSPSTPSYSYSIRYGNLVRCLNSGTR